MLVGIVTVTKVELVSAGGASLGRGIKTPPGLDLVSETFGGSEE